MRFVAVIPARHGSTRLSAKPLRVIGGKPLLAWVIEKAKQVQGLDELVVATDHKEIMQLSESLGVRGIMTDPALPSGTDRVHAAAKDIDADIVFNIQGDEPLLNPKWVEGLMDVFRKDSKVQMATVATDLPLDELETPQVVKVLVNKNFDSIYFSRFAIPYSRKTANELGVLPLKHIGLYAFRKSFLIDFCKHPVTKLEQAESLEQLRALEMGHLLRVIKVTGNSIGIDTEADVQKLESILKSDRGGQHA